MLESGLDLVEFVQTRFEYFVEKTVEGGVDVLAVKGTCFKRREFKVLGYLLHSAFLNYSLRLQVRLVAYKYYWNVRALDNLFVPSKCVVEGLAVGYIEN